MSRSTKAVVARTPPHQRIKQKIDNEGSKKVTRHERLLKKAEVVFGDVASAREWLTHKQPGLGGVVPIDFARTKVGAREVENLLGRIEHGAHS